MTIRNSTKDTIDNKISELPNITMIYGGATDKTLNDRKKEHINTDNRFNGMKSRLIYSTKSFKLVKEIEEYLIEELAKKYKNKCINDRNNNGQIAQRGGAGIREGSKLYRFYIMYK